MVHDLASRLSSPASVVGVEMVCSLLQSKTYELFPPVSRVLIRGNGEKPQVITNPDDALLPCMNG